MEGGGALQGAIAQVRPRPPPHTAGFTRGPGYRRRRADHRTGRVSLPAPSLASRPWAHLSAPPTLCRRSPPPGMGTVAAFGPRAGFRSRVGERGSLAPPTPGICGRGWWPRPYPRLGTSPAGPLCHHHSPSYPRYKGRGRGAHPHARHFPVLRTRPASHHEGGVVLVHASAGREDARGWGRRQRVGWTLTPHLEVGVQSPHAPVTSFGPEVTCDEGLLHSGQDVPTLCTPPEPSSFFPGYLSRSAGVWTPRCLPSVLGFPLHQTQESGSSASPHLVLRSWVPPPGCPQESICVPPSVAALSVQCL